ncbi:hypothetical protein DFJ74DRAFT_775585 [Hyaloraphidium curvatum]|nr:hypothetical protein DFJ74DRAFT_775585 [Hyaloraphidium curvatum]
MDADALESLTVGGGSLFVPTVTNALFPPLSAPADEDLDRALFLDDSRSGHRLTLRLLLSSSHAFARGLRDNRGVAYLWSPYRKGDSVGVVLPGEAQDDGLPLGWEWSMLEMVVAAMGILKGGGTIVLYRHSPDLPARIKRDAEAARGTSNADISLERDLTVPESPSAGALPGRPPLHAVPPPPRLVVTPPTLPVPSLPNLFYGHPEIPESVAWRNGTRPLLDLCDRGALLRDEILPTLVAEDAERWAVWSADEGKGWKHSEIVAYFNDPSLHPPMTDSLSVDPLTVWQADVFVSSILLGISRGQTVVFTRPGRNGTPEPKL